MKNEGRPAVHAFPPAADHSSPFPLPFHPSAFRLHPYSSSTQVSLVPPPCEELTTSEPSRSATRVSPPGTSVTALPLNTYGRRSTWRGAIPEPQKVGQVESASVGWAMK